MAMTKADAGRKGGKIGGSKNTEAQQAARRENGKKGGRPKTKKT